MPSSLHLISILSIDFILLFIRIFANRWSNLLCRNTIDGVSFIYEVFLSISDRIVRENHGATGNPFVEGGRFDERKKLFEICTIDIPM